MVVLATRSSAGSETMSASAALSPGAVQRASPFSWSTWTSTIGLPSASWERESSRSTRRFRPSLISSKNALMTLRGPSVIVVTARMWIVPSGIRSQ